MRVCGQRQSFELVEAVMRLPSTITEPPVRLVGKLFKKLFHRYALGRLTDSYDLRLVANFQAAWTSAQYYTNALLHAVHFDSKEDFLVDAVRQCSIQGLYLEFGVATGGTLRIIASTTPEKVYGFDCFSGLPEEWRPGFPKGSFSATLPSVPHNVELVVGLFEDTLPEFMKAHQRPISLLHIDCDLYSSTKCIFDCAGDRIIAGTIIVFDEYINYPGWCAHEYRAFQEFVRQHDVKYSYHSLVPSHQQVCVKIDAVGGDHLP
jgi:hypothetical protein